MKNSGLLLFMLLAATFSLRAQVSVDVSLDQDQFLPGEAMPLTVRITNRSGQTIQLGKDQEWLTFLIESKEGFVVVKTGEVPVEGEFTLESSKRGIKQVDLAPYFSFPKTGRYVVTASVFIKDWNQQISSAPKAFDIIQGSKMWEQEVGLPLPPGVTNQTPELRKYTLHQANYLRTRLMLYVQVSDANGKIYRVFPVGPMLSFGQPEPQVDRVSNLHLLFQDGQRSYNYTVIDPQGKVLIHHEYDMAPRPKLKVNAGGLLEVVGGIQRVTPNDVPPAKPVEDNAETAKP
jgi:hypothetical protein